MQERLYQYAVIKHPTKEKRDEGARSEIIIKPSEFMLARTEDEVMIAATRRIPEDQLEDADRLEVAIRPF
jgi:hypothetical protein